MAIFIWGSLIGLFNVKCEISNASSFSKSAIFKKISGVAASAVASSLSSFFFNYLKYSTHHLIQRIYVRIFLLMLFISFQ